MFRVCFRKLKTVKKKQVNQEEKKWIIEEIHAIMQLIKECEERKQRKVEIQVMKRKIRALEKKERQ